MRVGCSNGNGLPPPALSITIPVVAETIDAGKSVILHLLCVSQRSVYWDIPHPCAEAEKWAGQLGFIRQRPLLRMYLGQNNAVGIPTQLWAISDPATG